MERRGCAWVRTNASPLEGPGLSPPMESFLGWVGVLPLVHGADTEHVTLHMPGLLACDEDEDDGQQ